MQNSLNADLNETLIQAVMDQDFVLIERLLTQGANIEHVNSNANTPLLVAIDNDYLEVTKFLLQRGADPNATHGSNLPLILAADVAVQITNGHDDVESDSTEMIELLLKYGADPLKFDPNNNKNAYEFAKDYHTPAQRLFEQRLGLPPAP